MGRIHPKAEIHFSTMSRDKRIVEPILSCFDVTYARRVERADGEVSVFYLKPEQFMAEMLGTDRELLLVYSPFASLQARAIKIQDEIFEREKLRLDPIGTVLISDAENTSEAVKEFTVNDPERPPIVALSVSELSELSSADSVRRVFIERLFRRDLFGLESPLKTDRSFFGRHELTSELVDRFRSGQNSGLFGLRRIGKTSVLYAVQRRIQAAELGGATYIDVSNPALYRVRWWQLLQEIVRHIAAPLDLKRAARSKTRALTIDYLESDGARHFRADIQHLATFFPKKTLLLQLDEVENITFEISPADHWTTDFLPLWQTLRSVHQDTRGAFCFMVAGVNPKLLETERVGKQDNPLFSTVKPYYVAPFEPATIREMVRRLGRYMGIRFEEQLYARLHQEYGGHPFLVRQACSHLVKRVSNRPTEVSVDVFKNAREAIAIRLERNIKQILNVLAIWYPEEYELIRLLAGGDTKTFLEFARDNATFTEHMEGYGLVATPREDPTITIGLVSSYLSKQPAPERSKQVAASSREDVLAEVSRRRNAIEIALRKVIRDGLKFGRGNKAADALRSSLSSDRAMTLLHLGYDGIFEELYFNELRQILSKNWDCFQKFFSRDSSEICGYLDHINRSRADAHARSLSDEDLAYLRVCFRRLEEHLDLH